MSIESNENTVPPYMADQGGYSQTLNISPINIDVDNIIVILSSYLDNINLLIGKYNTHIIDYEHKYRVMFNAQELTKNSYSDVEKTLSSIKAAQKVIAEWRDYMTDMYNDICDDINDFSIAKLHMDSNLNSGSYRLVGGLPNTLEVNAKAELRNQRKMIKYVDDLNRAELRIKSAVREFEREFNTFLKTKTIRFNQKSIDLNNAETLFKKLFKQSTPLEELQVVISNHILQNPAKFSASSSFQTFSDSLKKSEPMNIDGQTVISADELIAMMTDTIDYTLKTKNTESKIKSQLRLADTFPANKTVQDLASKLRSLPPADDAINQISLVKRESDNLYINIRRVLGIIYALDEVDKAQYIKPLVDIVQDMIAYASEINSTDSSLQELIKYIPKTK